MINRLIKTYIAPLFIGLFMLCTNSVHAAAPQITLKDDSKIKAMLGVYVMEVYNIDFSRDTFNTVFWLWWIYTDNNYKPYNSIELVNALEEKQSHKSVEKIGDLYRAEVKVMARVAQDWDFVNFPFGKQTLELSLEDALMPHPNLTLIPDKRDSGIAKKFVEGWRVTDFKIKSKVKSLDTNFGYPESYQESDYSNVTAYIDIERNPISLLIKYYIGFFVAIFLCVILYFIRTDSLEVRMAVVIASTFSAIGNKYILDRILPDQAQITFSDKVQILTFSVILISAMSSTLTDYLRKNTSVRTAKTLNIILGVGTTLVTILLITLFVYQAVTAHASN